MNELFVMFSSKGYGFLFLVDSSSVSRVLSDRNHVINGKKAMCKIASPRKKNHLPKNVGAVILKFPLLSLLSFNLCNLVSEKRTEIFERIVRR